MKTPTIVESLLQEIRESVSSSSRINVMSIDGVSFSIQLGQSAEAIVSVSVCDPDRPSFSATYPALIVDRHGQEAIEERTSEAILSQGVSWIVRKVYRYGFVSPQGYRKPHTNSGKADVGASDEDNGEQAVAPNRSLARKLKSTSSVRGSED